MIALATGLKLYYLVKTFMAFAMVICYAVLILAVFPTVFQNSSLEVKYQEDGMPLGAQMTILLVIFLTMVTYHARLVEVTSRLDFIWKEQAEKELANMKSNRFLNDVLIKVSALIWTSQLHTTRENHRQKICGTNTDSNCEANWNSSFFGTNLKWNLWEKLEFELVEQIF